MACACISTAKCAALNKGLLESCAQGPRWSTMMKHQVQCRDLLKGSRRSPELHWGLEKVEPLHKAGFVCSWTQCGRFLRENVQFGERTAVWKGGYDFLLSWTNLNLLRSQERFLVQYNKDTFRITASFSERVSYVNAASEKFPSAWHFNSAFKTCKTETQRKTPWKYFGFHLFSIFTSAPTFFFSNSCSSSQAYFKIILCWTGKARRRRRRFLYI